MEEHEINFYKEKVKNFRGTPGQIGYGSLKSQNTRFEIIAELLWQVIQKSPKKQYNIVDFGCGKGDFLHYLEDYSFKFINKINYIGIDAIEENISDAKNNACEALEIKSVKFIYKNWNINEPLIDSQDIDFIIFSGPFATTNAKTRNQILSRFFNLAKIGVIGNFLTYNARVPSYEDGCVLTYPSEVLSLIDSSEFKINLQQDYLPHDFTISAVKWEPEL